jgi:hypothetical protein
VQAAAEGAEVDTTPPYYYLCNLAVNQEAPVTATATQREELFAYLEEKGAKESNTRLMRTALAADKWPNLVDEFKEKYAPITVPCLCAGRKWHGYSALACLLARASKQL